jgi:hypothetical protein
MKKHHTSHKRSNIVITTSFVSTLVLGALSVGALRENNLRMLDLRQKVLDADARGESATEELSALQQHVTDHMNATPPKLGNQPAIQLTTAYTKALEAEAYRVSQARTQIANEATAYCESTLSGARLSTRADCVANYTAARPVTERTVVADLYRHDFVSPTWSPDLAGWLLVACFASAMVCVVQIAIRLTVSMIIKK